ncbi:MAG: ZPR1 zinc finger domain-containing protein, partial [Terriglobus roseus]|nr:ZPR1 zinc finger domain-containing protein [Terriglobus roseus]
GRRITLRVEKPEDLSRDILKSETCALHCPEIRLSVQPGTLGGRFTTVEGLLTQIRDDLRSNIFSDEDGVEGSGDSMSAEERQKWNDFFALVDSAIAGEQKFTVVLEDPFAASYVQSRAEDGPDAQITIEDYDRTAEEEEDLGLQDIKLQDEAQDGGENASHEKTETS